jgi:conserved hypothetical protein YmdA/YtgF
MFEIIISAVVAVLVSVPIGIIIGINYRKNVAEKVIGSAEQQAKNILADGIKAADTKKKEAMLEAKEEILRSKTEAENEIKERRSELSQKEARVTKKEENLDRKNDALEKKDETLNKKIKENADLGEKIQEAVNAQLAELERISGMTSEQARDSMVNRLKDEVVHEQAIMLTELEAQFKEDADAKAKEILSIAIQRCAADHVAETTVSVVTLPNEEMKGRIIGREGRNIRTIETLTGVDLIVDDTPEAIAISGFDPAKREIAKIALEKLIFDGRIHPARVEEMVEKARREVETIIKQAGDKATFETGVHGVNIEMIKLLGRLKYRTSFGQNVLNHSIEVSLLSGMIADEMGIDSTIAKRAGLLHDIGKALTQEVEGSHVELGVEIVRKYKESKEVIHAIEAHHNDVEPLTITAMIVQAADAISAARPGARRENLENYIKRLQKLEEIALEFDGVDKVFAIQAGREIRVLVKPETVNDDQMKLLSREIVKKIEGELEYPGQIKVHLIRESRAIEFAK